MDAIKTVSDFIRDVSAIKLESEKQLFFRGHRDKDFKLLPSLYRTEEFPKSEHTIYKDTIVHCPHDFTGCKSTLEILVKMQHYGVPTRLLDLTCNALVALYFACIKEEDKKEGNDGKVIVLQIPDDYICYYDSDKIIILSNLAKQKESFYFEYDKDKLKSDPDKVIKSVNKKYFGYLLHSIREDKPHFFDIINPKDIENVYAVFVKLDNPRIIRQDGAFLMFGCEKTKKQCAKIDSSWIVKEIIVPHANKTGILNELEVLGIKKYTLFPELDIFADYLKQSYIK